MSLQTYATFDLPSEEPARRASVRAGRASDGAEGPVFAELHDARPVRHYEVTISSAQVPDLLRLRQLWTLTRSGVLPMTLEHDEDGTVVVAFEDDVLELIQTSSGTGRFVVRLVELIGYA